MTGLPRSVVATELFGGDGGSSMEGTAGFSFLSLSNVPFLPMLPQWPCAFLASATLIEHATISCLQMVGPLHFHDQVLQSEDVHDQVFSQMARNKHGHQLEVV